MRIPFMLIALSGLLFAPTDSARGENPADNAVAAGNEFLVLQTPWAREPVLFGLNRR